MRLIVDANILVAELLRKRGRLLFKDKRTELFIAESVMDEASYELGKRVDLISEHSGAPEDQLEAFLKIAFDTVKENIHQVALSEYQGFEREALWRIPRDPDDWHTVALALALQADIWTQDKDFLGCGVATWTTETLQAKLES